MTVLTRQSTKIDVVRNSADFPAEAPLEMNPQCFRTGFRDEAAPNPEKARRLGSVRLGLLAAVIGLTSFAASEMLSILEPGGLTILEIAIAFLFTLTFIGISIGCVTALYGAILALWAGEEKYDPRVDQPEKPLSVALLVLTYNEPPEPVLANVAAMAEGLAKSGGKHRYSIYVLSDSTSAEIAERERAAVNAVRITTSSGIPIHYRHRERNFDRKVGNLRDWCTRWGGRHDGMMVLDADSLMAPIAIRALSDALAKDPGAGLIQSVPKIVNDQTLFARLQAFANALTGPVFARGMASWTGADANYWGHNAIIRTRAFAASAGLPHLSGRAPFGGLVMSHDFIEAALIRRAGWRVEMRPDIEGSYEEAPPSLIDFIQRDYRWCQGNLQHLRLLNANGFHLVSRFHLLNGIMAYLSAPLWALFLVIGAVIAGQGANMPIDYFPDPFSMFPSWPVIDSERAFTILIFTIGVLLAPKIASLLVVLRRDPMARRWGGWQRLLPAVIAEILFSALVAPILMVHQCLAVFRMVIGRDNGWRPQRQFSNKNGVWLDRLQFHAVETLLGLFMLYAIATGVLTVLILPIAVSLALAIPLSAIFCTVLSGRLSKFAASPDLRHLPAIVRAQLRHRRAMA